MQNLIQRLFQPESVASDGLTQTQREAMIDLLIMAMYADNRITLQEDNLLDTNLHQFNWESGIQPDYYLSQATGRIRPLLDQPDSREKLLLAIRQNLTLPDIRRRALLLCESLMESDQATAPGEIAFLESARQILRN